MLVAGCWLLVAGCRLLVAGCRLLVAGCWLPGPWELPSWEGLGVGFSRLTTQCGGRRAEGRGQRVAINYRGCLMFRDKNSEAGTMNAVRLPEVNLSFCPSVTITPSLSLKNLMLSKSPASSRSVLSLVRFRQA